jgi:hypothetical protein
MVGKDMEGDTVPTEGDEEELVPVDVVGGGGFEGDEHMELDGDTIGRGTRDRDGRRRCLIFRGFYLFSVACLSRERREL